MQSGFIQIASLLNSEMKIRGLSKAGGDEGLSASVPPGEASVQEPFGRAKSKNSQGGHGLALSSGLVLRPPPCAT